ncbi:hypothetical protein IQ230_03660 [Gloeocapsopsis crepidinum LEGE 06123]|uniref:Uncharacterized protein n=1 Tax=Gloeocapsopsis crepidinum LEGE 06123 TaxID=588587 RepID=A0ABR9UPE8_9CHRO|nr:hypothetical protein [Gloeocapsopsis crepidinum]MBE9189475.1 hypothetical protein [Gloeocapsopsis crepidinum LEGE 06123]
MSFPSINHEPNYLNYHKVLGDLHPFIALGLDLRDRGHDIVFATIKDYCAKYDSEE